MSVDGTDSLHSAEMRITFDSTKIWSGAVLLATRHSRLYLLSLVLLGFVLGTGAAKGLLNEVTAAWAQAFLSAAAILGAFALQEKSNADQFAERHRRTIGAVLNLAALAHAVGVASQDAIRDNKPSARAILTQKEQVDELIHMLRSISIIDLSADKAVGELALLLSFLRMASNRLEDMAELVHNGEIPIKNCLDDPVDWIEKSKFSLFDILYGSTGSYERAKATGFAGLTP
jgi:hypothetical protein